MTGSWRAALRLGRRDLARHPVRALLTMLLVAAPVVVATVVALTAHNGRWTPEVSATMRMGQADALVEVTPFDRVRWRAALYGSAVPADGPRAEPVRDPAQVDVAGLLPAGTRLVPAPEHGEVRLATGGTAWLTGITDDPLSDGLVRLRDGRLPSGPDEIAVDPDVAEALDLVDADGALLPDAVLELDDGRTPAVVGLVAGEGDLQMAVTPDFPGVDPATAEGTDQPSARYLVDLPALPTQETKELTRTLAGSGVALNPRAVLLDPEAFGLSPDYSRSFEAVLAASLVVLVGLVEVVLLVGAAFAVAARRQVRELGLVMSNGGEARHLRRQLLAQGLVLGVLASVIGTAAGIGLFFAGTGVLEDRVGLRLYSRELDWLSVLVVLLLGSATAVVAALLPAWTIGRLTPVQALTGRFPVAQKQLRRRTAPFVLSGAGLFLVLAGGYVTSRWFAPRASENPLPVYVAVVGFVLLVAGLLWATPTLVHLAAGAGRALPLSGRFAWRAASRHRFRTAAATSALTFTVAVAILTAFLLATVAREEGAVGEQEHRVSIDLGSVGRAVDVAQVRSTVEGVLGPAELVVTQQVGLRDVATLATRQGWGVSQVEESMLPAVLGRPVDPDTLAAYRDGAALVIGRAGIGRVTDGEAVFRLDGREQRRIPLPVHQVPEVAAPANDADRVLISPETTERLDLTPQWATIRAFAQRDVTRGDLRQLSALGLNAWSEEPDLTMLRRAQYAGIGAAALLALLVVGIAVALAAAEGKDEAATLTAVGAGPLRRRGIGAMHGLFIGLVGCALGLVVAVPSGIAFTQVDGRAGIDVPWIGFLGTLAAVVAFSPLAGWVVTPTRLRLDRRTG